MDKPEQNAFPLFKGATRVPLFMGVPLLPLLLSVFVVFVPASLVSIWWWLALIPIYFGMRLIVKHDERAFSIWGLWIDTGLRNRNKAFWKASTYAPATYHKRDRYGR